MVVNQQKNADYESDNVKDKDNLASHNIWSANEYTKNVTTDIYSYIPQGHSLTLNTAHHDIGNSCIDLYFNLNGINYPFFDYIFSLPSESSGKTLSVKVKTFRNNESHNCQLILNSNGTNLKYVKIPSSETFNEVTLSEIIPDNITDLRIRFVIWNNSQAVEGTHLFIDNISIDISKR